VMVGPPGGNVASQPDFRAPDRHFGFPRDPVGAGFRTVSHLDRHSTYIASAILPPLQCAVRLDGTLLHGHQPTTFRGSMRILVLGGDGYLGWPTALHLSALGHDVAVNDNFARRGYDEEMGVESLVPIATLEERIAAWKEISGRDIKPYVGDLIDPAFVHQVVADFRPNTIVHFGEQRAAPYSMID